MVDENFGEVNQPIQPLQEPMSMKSPMPVKPAGRKSIWLYSGIGLVIVVIVIVLIFFRSPSGDQSNIFEPGQELTAQQLKSGVLGEAEKINSYHYSMIMDIEMEISSSETGDFSMVSIMEMVGDVDTLNERASVFGSMTSEAGGFNMDVEVESYVVDNFYYTKVFGNWVKQEADSLVWDEQDQANQIIKLIEDGEIVISGEDSFDGNEYYVVELDPSLEEVVEQALREQEQSDLYNSEMDFGDIIKEYRMTLWINKETLFVEKSVTYMEMEMNAENMGGMSAEILGGIFLVSEVEVRITNINEDVEIILPEEALDAQELDFYLGGSGSGVLLSPTGMEIEKVFR